MKDPFSIKIPFVQAENAFNFFKRRDNFIWLDSCLKNSRNRYSVIAFEPFLVFESKKRAVSIKTPGEGEKKINGNPLDALSELLGFYKVRTNGFFSPGALGYLGYDLGRQVERIPDIGKDSLNLPDIYMGFYETLILFDHKEKSTSIVSANLSGRTPEDYKSKLKKLASELRNLPQTVLSENNGNSFETDCISSNIEYEMYARAVGKIRDYIAGGEVYQINFARRIKAKGSFPADKMYLKLRKVSPAPFAAFFDTGKYAILSNSPELFLEKTGRRILTLPMKGTRPRGKNMSEDSLFKKQLLSSSKERAELVMIIDLERNDMGKVCEFGSVKTNKIWHLEKYSTVFQTTGEVEGVLREHVTPAELLKALFPGGSITGAPKIRAMEIIEELEPERRSYYTGSLGYIGFNGNMKLNILIRSVLVKDNFLYYSVGGGIVWDSDPEEEFKETQAKAKALFLTLGEKNGKILSV